MDQSGVENCFEAVGEKVRWEIGSSWAGNEWDCAVRCGMYGVRPSDGRMS